MLTGPDGVPSGGGSGMGGAIFNLNGSVSMIISSTIASNLVVAGMGGIATQFNTTNLVVGPSGVLKEWRSL